MVDGDTSNAGGPATVRQTLGHTTLNAGPEAEGFTFARSQTLLSRVWWLAYPTKTVSSGDSVFAPPELEFGGWPLTGPRSNLDAQATDEPRRKF